MDFPAISHTDTHHSPETIHWNANRMRTSCWVGHTYSNGVEKNEAHIFDCTNIFVVYITFSVAHIHANAMEWERARRTMQSISLNRRREIANTHVRCTVCVHFDGYSLFSVKFRSIFSLSGCVFHSFVCTAYHRQSSFGTCSTELLYWSKQSYQPNTHSKHTNRKREKQRALSLLSHSKIFSLTGIRLFRSVRLCCAVLLREIEKIVPSGLFVYGLVERLCDTVR